MIIFRSNMIILRSNMLIEALPVFQCHLTIDRSTDCSSFRLYHQIHTNEGDDTPTENYRTSARREFSVERKRCEVSLARTTRVARRQPIMASRWSARDEAALAAAAADRSGSVWPETVVLPDRGIISGREAARRFSKQTKRKQDAQAVSPSTSAPDHSAPSTPAPDHSATARCELGGKRPSNDASFRAPFSEPQPRPIMRRKTPMKERAEAAGVHFRPTPEAQRAIIADSSASSPEITQARREIKAHHTKVYKQVARAEKRQRRMNEMTLHCTPMRLISVPGYLGQLYGEGHEEADYHHDVADLLEEARVEERPRPCRSCRALLPANFKFCLECGLSTAPSCLGGVDAAADPSSTDVVAAATSGAGALGGATASPRVRSAQPSPPPAQLPPPPPPPQPPPHHPTPTPTAATSISTRMGPVCSGVLGVSWEDMNPAFLRYIVTRNSR